jgi:hypothetical protein
MRLLQMPWTKPEIRQRTRRLMRMLRLMQTRLMLQVPRCHTNSPEFSISSRYVLVFSIFFTYICHCITVFSTLLYLSNNHSPGRILNDLWHLRGTQAMPMMPMALMRMQHLRKRRRLLLKRMPRRQRELKWWVTLGKCALASQDSTIRIIPLFENDWKVMENDGDRVQFQWLILIFSSAFGVSRRTHFRFS